MSTDTSPTIQVTKQRPNIRLKDRFETVGVPYRLISDETGYGGAFLHPALSGFSMSYGKTRKDLDRQLRIKLNSALEFYTYWCDKSRKMAIFIGERHTNGWWFSIIGIGLGFTRTGIMPFYKRLNFINMWSDDLKELWSRVKAWFRKSDKKPNRGD